MTDRHCLTPGDHATLKLIIEGLTNSEIAALQTIAEQTVANRVSRILLKLRARNRVQAAVLAVRSGMYD